MRIRFEKYPIDILLSITWSTIILPIATLNIEGTVRIILGLPFILFIPGYVLNFALFPTRKTDKGIDIHRKNCPQLRPLNSNCSPNWARIKLHAMGHTTTTYSPLSIHFYHRCRIHCNLPMDENRHQRKIYHSS